MKYLPRAIIGILLVLAGSMLDHQYSITGWLIAAIIVWNVRAANMDRAQKQSPQKEESRQQ